MDYKVIEIQNSQFLVKPGETVIVNGEFGEIGKTVSAKTLLASTAGKAEVGTPYLKDDTVLTVVKYQGSEKIRVATYRAKSRYRKVRGHRQQQTVLQIVGVKAKVETKPQVTKTEAPKKPAAKKPAAKKTK